MWRPKNWKNPNHLKDTDGDYYNQYPEFAIYEAGADAMLEALKDGGVFTYGYHTPDIELGDAKGESGYWCFIPHEEV